MSVICDVVILASMSENAAVEAVNARLVEVDTDRHQQFRPIDTRQAGGTKVFCAHVYAGAFNHLIPHDIEAAIAGAPWADPDHVYVWVDAYDYDLDPYGRTVAELRASAAQEDTHG